MRQNTFRFGNTCLVPLLRAPQTLKALVVAMLLVFVPASFAGSDPVSDRGTALVRWIEIEPGEQPRAYRNFDECVIYAPDPRWVAWTGSIGHEIAHCFAGAYHPRAGHNGNWGPWNEEKKREKAKKN